MPPSDRCPRLLQSHRNCPSSGGKCSAKGKLHHKPYESLKWSLARALRPPIYSAALRRELRRKQSRDYCAESSRALPWQLADERTRTAFLLQLRVIIHALRAFADACKFCMSKDFLCSGLQCVAPYCAPGGIRVVSMSPLHPRNYVIDERNVNPHPITIPIADSFANSHRL